MRRYVEGVELNVRTFLRTPLNAVLALVLPIVVIEGWGQAMAGLPAMPTVEAVPLTMGRLLGGVFGVAIIAGLLGLAQMISARKADRRLVQTGYPSWTLLATRLVTLGGVTVVVATVNYGVLRLTITPEAPVLAFVFLALAGVVYAFIGALVGAVLPRLFEGSLIVVFLAMMDAFLSGDSPLAADVPEFVQYFPLYHPKELLQAAVFDGTFATADLVFVGGYVLVLLVLVTVVFGVTMRTSGGWST
ncbi:ABC transporter permease [Halolamina sp. C58]|uniref:ABC transporter permease n=1 Tax=Halolamina sp. C58 TaxID=3421640 RepID=UPI003EB8B5B4